MPALKTLLTNGLQLNTGDSLHGLAGTGAAITFTAFGVEALDDTNLQHRVLATGQLATSDSLIYSPAPGRVALVSTLILANTSGSLVTGISLGINGSSATAGNQIVPSISIPANGVAILSQGGLSVNDANGNVYQTVAPVTIGGIASIAAASAGINTVETQVVGQTFGAGAFNIGTTLDIDAYGTITSTVDNVVTFNIRVGATLTGNIPATLAVHCGNTGTVTNAAFVLHVRVVIRTIGASGTVYAYGYVISLDSGAAVTQALALATELFVPTSRAVDTTVANTVELDFVSAASTSTATFQAATIAVVKS